MIETAIIISLATLGFRAITDTGMVFYFLRKPFDKMSTYEPAYNHHKEELRLLLIHKGNWRDFERIRYEELLYNDNKFFHRTSKKNKWLLYLMKPIILCVTCMASLHTLIWWPHLVGAYDFNTIAVMLMVAFMNTVAWSIIELIRKGL